MSATPTADLIPVRALNQVTYCPRLYYLQYVDAVMPVNEHVEGGLFDHRRVDEATLANKTRKEGDANRSRGVHLSSETLGISGILDVIEEKDGASYPVETKHGSAPRNDDGKATTWDNDAVQLCARRCSWRRRSAPRWSAASNFTRDRRREFQSHSRMAQG